MSKRSADAAGVKSANEADSAQRLRITENAAAASSLPATAAAAADPPDAAASALLPTPSFSSSALASTSVPDPFLALQAECNASTFTRGLLAQLAATPPSGAYSLLVDALESDFPPIDFTPRLENNTVFSQIMRIVAQKRDADALLQLLSLLQQRIHEWTPDSPAPCDRVSLLAHLFCIEATLTSLSPDQIDFLEELTVTLLDAGADLTWTTAHGETAAMSVAWDIGSQTLLARMLRTPCHAPWSSAAMLTMVWQRNDDDQSLLDILLKTRAPHDAIWKSNLSHVKEIKRFWSVRVKPALSDFLVRECGLVTDVAHMCLDYIDGVNRSNTRSSNDSPDLFVHFRSPLPPPMSFNPPTGGASMHARSNLQTASGVRAFGLQLPKSKQQTPAAGAASKPAVKAFGFSMDDDDDTAESAPGPAQLASIRAKKYAQQQARVLAEAPDAFSYDDVYEERAPAAAPASRLGLSTAAAAAAAGRAPQPAVSAPSRYISALLSKSASRKLESEAVFERNLLKERSADDALHAGKEKFVTEGFKAQRAEQEAARRKQEEQDARDEAMERVRMKGGAAANLGLSLAASRRMLDSRAGTAESVAAAESTAAAVAPPAAAAAAAAPKRSAPAAAESASALSHSDAASSAVEEPSSKRSRLEPPTAAASAMADAAPDSTAAVAPSSTPTAAAAPKIDAIAAVAAKLTTERATLSKKEEALAKLAARKAAAAAQSS